MQIINHCICCKKQWTTIVQNECWDCLFKKYLTSGNEYKKKYFWKETKKFSYDMLLYLPACVFIGLKWSIWYELTFIGGGIFTTIIPYVRDWLTRKF